MNATLIVWGTFFGVFGGALLMWWFGGGYKKYLKYKSDFNKEKEKLEKDSKDVQSESEVKSK